VLPDLEPVSLGLKEVLIEPKGPIGHVWFPIDGVCSVVATMEDGQVVEVGTVGNEGMVGLPVFLGRESVPLGTFCQVPGEAVRMRSEALRTEVGPGDKLHGLLRRYTQATFVFAAQGNTCNRLHSVGQRCARWLLHTHDRVGSDEFPLTQEFLAQMLGMRRASVSGVAGDFRGVPDLLLARHHQGARPDRLGGEELRVLPGHPRGVRPPARGLLLLLGGERGGNADGEEE
jgi:CRP-like cAMP-binding protein